MSSIDLFSKYKELLSNLNTSIDIIQNDGRSVYVSLWKNDENLSHNINQLKQQSEKLSSTCTKVGLINPNTMPLNGLQSLLDEVLVGGQSVFQCYRSESIFSLKIFIFSLLVASLPRLQFLHH